MNSRKRLVEYIDWGRISFKAAWDRQQELFERIVEQKIALRKQPIDHQFPQNYLITCEHDPVYTLGKSGREENLLLSKAELAARGFDYYRINRGGDITYHGPGQLVVYPLLDLDQFFTDIHKYLRYLEEAVIATLADFGIRAGRLEGLTGVWLEPEIPARARKICAMGIKCGRWVTMHGLALNVHTKLQHFEHIVPCGIDDKEVTSMSAELQQTLSMEEVSRQLLLHLTELFEWQVVDFQAKQVLP